MLQTCWVIKVKQLNAQVKSWLYKTPYPLYFVFVTTATGISMNFLHEIATWHVLLSRKYNISRSAQRQGRFLVVSFVVEFFKPESTISSVIFPFPLQDVMSP